MGITSIVITRFSENIEPLPSTLRQAIELGKNLRRQHLRGGIVGEEIGMQGAC